MTNKAPAATRLIEIINFIEKNDKATFLEISQNLNIPKSSTHHLLQVLIQSDFLKKRDDLYFVLGLRLFELGASAVKNSDLRQKANIIMHELVQVTQLTSHLGVLEGNTGLFLNKVESPNAVVSTSWAGKRIIFNQMALGKVLLAWETKERQLELLQDCQFVKKTDTTITCLSSYLEHLEQVKEQGWAIDDGEDIAEICCMAAPIFDSKGKVIAALGINGLQSQYSGGKKQSHLKNLLLCSQKLSQQSGFQSI